MPAFLIVDTEITNPERFEEYKRQVSPLVERYGGRYCVRGGPHQVLEGDWEPTRVVMLEFPNMDTLMRWYDSPEYAPVKEVRQQASRTRMFAVEGM